MKVDLKNLDRQEMEAWAEREGLEAYRARQIRRWLFQRFATSFEQMTDLPKSLRAGLKKRTNLKHLETLQILSSVDGSKKFLFELPDGHHIESVLIPERDHYTLCVSTQAGCAMGCRFCATGRSGLKRNLHPAEMLEQVIRVKRFLRPSHRLTNLVFMGMGEPLANYDAVVKAARNLISKDGLNFSHRRVTLSTCGLVPQIDRLGRDVTLNLAVSLNAPNDRIRSFLMPVNKLYPLDSLLSACKRFPLPNRRRITFEYVLIEGINDAEKHALEVAKLLTGTRGKINLIPLNPHPEIGLSPPPREQVLRFQAVLVKQHFTAIIRESKGKDISAACGQLSGSFKDQSDEKSFRD